MGHWSVAEWGEEERRERNSCGAQEQRKAEEVYQW